MTRKRKKTYPGYSFMRSSGGIDEYILSKNGLQVLYVPDHTFPVVGINVIYRVGSVNEAVGYTGATHLLEHLMFKGSKHFPAGARNDLTTIFEKRGALLNATTGFDRTNYYAIVSREHFEEIIAVEADRMRHATIDEKGRAREMVVVRNEFERGENDPLEVLDKAIWASAFREHPYHHPTIGWRSDIENVPTGRLKEFYDTYYWPNNATIVVAGDIMAERALRTVKQCFGKHFRSPHKIPVVYTKEPRQEGIRRVSVERFGETNIVGIAHKIPEGTHRDTHALEVLTTILTSGRNSRLERSLVDTGLASSIETYVPALRHPGLMAIYARISPDVPHDDVERAIICAYDDIRARGVTAKELAAAKEQITTAAASDRDGVYAMLSALTEAVALGNWRFFTTFHGKTRKVAMRDIKRVANTYLIPDQSTIGYFIGRKV